MKAECEKATTDSNKPEPVDLKSRTKAFALRIINLYSSLPKTTTAQVIGKQILRSATSVGASYREGTRSRTNTEFISKLALSTQELEETIYWMELLVEAKIVSQKRLNELMNEANELMAILVTCIKNAKQKSKG